MNEQRGHVGTHPSSAPSKGFGRSREWYDRASATAPGGVHTNVRLGERPLPLFFESGSGGLLRDVDGNVLVDLVCGNGPLILGHSPKPVVEAVRRQVERGLVYAGQSTLEVEAAELLAAHVPCAERVRFNMTGTEAIQAAIRIARAATGRQKLLMFQGHYDGWADSVIWNVGTGSEPVAEGADLVTPMPETQGVARSVGGDLLILQWNDADALERTVAAHGDEIAAVIMEPVMANSGAIVPLPGYLEAVRRITNARGIVLIFDEVITGFRVAKGGAQERFGVTPDMAVFGKAIAAGFPVAAVVGRADLFDGVGTGRVMHAGTFNSNPVGMAAAIASLRYLTDPANRVYERLEENGAWLMDGIREAARAVNAPALVQGLPAVFCLSWTRSAELRDHRDLARCDPAGVRALQEELVRRGVRIAGRPGGGGGPHAGGGGGGWRPGAARQRVPVGCPRPRGPAARDRRDPGGLGSRHGCGTARMTDAPEPLPQGHVRTVTGALPVGAVGRTLIHEHVICDLTTYWRPQDAPEDAHRSVSLATLAHVRADPFAIRHDLELDQMDVAVEELGIHRDLGGGTVVEVTSHGIGRDVRALEIISRRSGVPIVAGCGYYIGSSRPRGFEKRTVGELADELLEELTEGIEGSTIKAGVIGEIGVGGWPMSDHERTMLRAAARAQRETDAGMIVHPAPGTDSALELVRVLDRAGARMDKVVISHLDERFRSDVRLFQRIGRTGVRFGFDTFGRETYYTSRHRQHPSDAERIQTVLRLWDIGLGDRLGLAQDICIRHELSSWGGPGYGHILGRIVPRLRHEGLGDAEIETMLVHTPAALLVLPGSGE